MANDDLYERVDDRDLHRPFGMEPQGGNREQEPRTSGLAVASLVSSLVFCCPAVTVMGPILGIAHLATASGKPWLRGRGLAIAGILIGGLFTAISALIIWGAVSLFSAAMRMPGEAIARIERLDDAGARELFAAGSIPAGTEAMEEFARELDRRYGAFISASIDEAAPPPSDPGGGAFTLPMRFAFERGSLAGTCVVGPGDSGFELRLRSIEIHDPELGDLRFPPAGPSRASRLEDEPDGEDPLP